MMEPWEAPEGRGLADLMQLVTEQTAERLRRDGWTQQDYHSEDGRHCLYGALELTMRELGWTERYDPRRGFVEVAVARVLAGKPTPCTWQEVIEAWNDATGRDLDDVLGLLKRVGDAYT